jgi:Esterase-like activity of phytase
LTAYNVSPFGDRYAKDSSDSISGGMNNATNIFVTGDMTHISGDRYIVIERDDFQGPPTGANPPRQKKLYLIDLKEVDKRSRALKKRLLVDLLDIADPRDIGGPLLGIPDSRFNFPLQSVESLTPVNDSRCSSASTTITPGATVACPGPRTTPKSSRCARRFR